MQKPFKVQYAGIPDSRKTILADSEWAAAFRFLSQNVARNTIIVKKGFLSEKFFSFEELAPGLTEEKREHAPLLLPPEEGKVLPLWKEFLYRLVFGIETRNPWEK